MMDEEMENRHALAVLVLVLYTLPLLVLSGWTQITHDGWTLLSLGLLLTAAGTYTMMRRMESFERAFLTKLSQPGQSIAKEAESPIPDFSPFIEQIENQRTTLAEAEKAYNELTASYEVLTEDYQKILREKEVVQRQAEAHQQEHRIYKKNTQEQNDYQQLLLVEHQRSIAELRDLLEKKQQHIQQLESKTRDMNYEIKTLLQLAEKPVSGYTEPSVIPLHPARHPPTPKMHWETGEPNILDFAVRTNEEAHVHLKRLLDLAQRITGTSLFSSSPRFREMPLDNYALDLRSLFDRLKEINASTIIVYSLKENKLLFVNDQIKELLGLNPDKFVHQFQETVQEGQPEWREVLRQLSFKNEAKTTLQLKSRTGQEVNVECLLGIVPTGIFRHHLIGLLYKISLSSAKVHNL